MARTPSKKTATKKKYRPDPAKATKARMDQHEERIEYVLRLLVQRKKTSQIKTACEKKFGCSRKSVQPWIACAQSMIRARLGKSKGEMRDDMGYELVMVMDDPSAKPGDRIAAVREYSKLFGLRHPVEIDIGNKPGETFRFDFRDTAPGAGRTKVHKNGSLNGTNARTKPNARAGS